MNKRRWAQILSKPVAYAPLFAFLALAAWALASPAGASPDDDYHLVSIWCANGNPEYCRPADSPNYRIVPEPLLHSPCYAFNDEKSASCQDPYLAEPLSANILSNRGNFQGMYPPIYYKAMGVFAGPDMQRSVIVMRLVNAALFVGLTTLLFALLPRRRRPMLVWGWLITTVPLGLFLVSSTNPSGWAVVGVGTAWIALLGYFEAMGRRRITLGALFLISVFMAAGSRGDAAFYFVIAVGAVVVLTFEQTKSYLIRALLPAGGVIVALVFFLTSRHIGSGIHGVGGVSEPVLKENPELSTFGLLAYNLLNVPSLWSGVLGGWGLGWLDTRLPEIVLFTGGAAFIGVGFVGLSNLNRRKIVAISGVAALLIAIPVYVLTVAGDSVGTDVQPRYILPLIVLLGGLLLYEPTGQTIRFSRAQLVFLVAALTIGNLVSLHTNIRRYVTGVDGTGLSLDAGREWWWNSPITPNLVWLVGSVAFGATLILLTREISWRRDEVAVSATDGG